MWQVTLYTIADIAIWSWYGRLVQENYIQVRSEFLDVASYTHLKD